jgi:hypothetical protein
MLHTMGLLPEISKTLGLGTGTSVCCVEISRKAFATMCEQVMRQAWMMGLHCVPGTAHVLCWKTCHMPGCALQEFFTSEEYSRLQSLSGERRRRAVLDMMLAVEEVKDLAALAAGTGKLACLEVLRAWECPMGPLVWAAAGAEGHVDSLRWLHEVSPGTIGEHVTDCAAIAGHLDCLTFLHSINAPWTIYHPMRAAKAGQLPCLAFLVEHGCPTSPDACAGAAEDGQLACLRYLHAQGCPWDEETTINAAAGGHLDCLMFAVERGCPVKDGTFVAAVESGKQPCLEYLLESDFRPDEPLQLLRLENDSQLDCVEVAACYGVDVHPGQIVVAASLAQLRLVRYFHSAGYPLWHTARDGFAHPILEEGRTWRDWVSFVRARAMMAKVGGEQPTIWDGVLYITPWDEHLPACWATLRFGALHGAPLTPRAEALVQERQACAQEVVRCFHAARWLAAGGRRDSAKWAAMSRVPDDVLVMIMELAEVEIREALR